MVGKRKHIAVITSLFLYFIFNFGIVFVSVNALIFVLILSRFIIVVKEPPSVYNGGSIFIKPYLIYGVRSKSEASKAA